MARQATALQKNRTGCTQVYKEKALALALSRWQRPRYPELWRLQGAAVKLPLRPRLVSHHAERGVRFRPPCGGVRILRSDQLSIYALTACPSKYILPFVTRFKAGGFFPFSGRLCCTACFNSVILTPRTQATSSIDSMRSQ